MKSRNYLLGAIQSLLRAKNEGENGENTLQALDFLDSIHSSNLVFWQLNQLSRQYKQLNCPNSRLLG